MADRPGNPTVAVLGALGVAVCLALSFFYAYAGGLHAPKPHAVPFAVIASPPEYSPIADKLATTGDALSPRPVANSATAIKQIKQRSIYGAIEFGKPAHLYIGSAGSAVAAQLIVQAATEISAKNGRQIVTTDVVPLPARDPEGLITFYLVVAAVLGGYIAALFASTATGSTRFAFRAGLKHLAMFAGFAVAFGVLVMLIAGPLMGAVPGDDFFALAAVEALVFATASAVTLGLLAAFGQIAGFLCAITLLILLGNSSSGGASPHDFLPGFWRALNSILPNAAGVNATTDIAYFPNVSLAQPLLILAAWLVGGALVFLALRPSDPAAAESRQNR